MTRRGGERTPSSPPTARRSPREGSRRGDPPIVASNCSQTRRRSLRARACSIAAALPRPTRRSWFTIASPARVGLLACLGGDTLFHVTPDRPSPTSSSIWLSKKPSGKSASSEGSTPTRRFTPAEPANASGARGGCRAFSFPRAPWSAGGGAPREEDPSRRSAMKRARENDAAERADRRRGPRVARAAPRVRRRVREADRRPRPAAASRVCVRASPRRAIASRCFTRHRSCPRRGLKFSSTLFAGHVRHHLPATKRAQGGLDAIHRLGAIRSRKNLAAHPCDCQGDTTPAPLHCTTPHAPRPRNHAPDSPRQAHRRRHRRRHARRLGRRRRVHAVLDAQHAIRCVRSRDPILSSVPPSNGARAAIRPTATLPARFAPPSQRRERARAPPTLRFPRRPRLLDPGPRDPAGPPSGTDQP